jgi:hypothetical protein
LLKHRIQSEGYGLVVRFGEDDDVAVLGCDASALKMETVSFSETLVSTYESTPLHNPE